MAFAFPISGVPRISENASDSPIVTFFPVIRRGDSSVVYRYAGNSQYAIQIGCIDEETHVNPRGFALDYLMLFAYLHSKGYDPLRPIRGDQAKRHTGTRIGDVIVDVARSEMESEAEYLAEVRSKSVGELLLGSRMSRNPKGHLSVDMQIRNGLSRIASEIAEFVKDYIYGSVSIPSPGGASNAKPKLEDSTIKWRKANRREDPSLYGGESGIEEPLYETGQLYSSIKWRLVRCDVVSQYADARSMAAIKREYEKKLRRKQTGRKTAREMRKAYVENPAAKLKAKVAKVVKVRTGISPAVKTESDRNAIADKWIAENWEAYKAVRELSESGIYEKDAARIRLNQITRDAREHFVTYDYLASRWNSER